MRRAAGEGGAPLAWNARRWSGSITRPWPGGRNRPRSRRGGAGSRFDSRWRAVRGRARHRPRRRAPSVPFTSEPGPRRPIAGRALLAAGDRPRRGASAYGTVDYRERRASEWYFRRLALLREAVGAPYTRRRHGRAYGIAARGRPARGGPRLRCRGRARPAGRGVSSSRSVGGADAPNPGGAGLAECGGGHGVGREPGP